ncbi:UDP-glucosyltransferase 2 [Teleopsis dalmanni]|uniref:UDP-glucosyltransferase 2-like n=1 Tax=Teleopsis dalmanni TaxID=139649 RepID=UPI0018CD4272|nr:UDP-glucosyltransferase 2-like [Teleopsis dalmanni]XP_037961225.1 UDP-glucosyltransferase 2 [Teleopsis dalmanni]
MNTARINRLTLLGVALLFCAFQIQNVNSINILGLYTSHSPSHLIVHMSVAKALAEKGHNVTVVSSLEPKVTHKNINHIVIPAPKEGMEALDKMMSEIAKKKNSIFSTVRDLLGSMSIMLELQFDAMKDKRFTALYENPDNKFDVVILGFFMNDFQLGVAARFKAPIIVEWTAASNDLIDRYVGNPPEISYVSSMSATTTPGVPMTFLQRLKNVFERIFFRGVELIINNLMRRYYRDLYPRENFPTYDEMKKNVSMIFTNSHFSEGLIRPNVPAVVEMGGIQIKDKPDPLPKDIDDLMNASKENGAILFSLGSNLKSDFINPNTNKIIYNVLSKLKQNVIWKWEDLDNTPGKASNIIYKKWLPQDDILAHPNLKLFITHAGKGGIAEAQYHGVPMVALPCFADQSKNAEYMEQSGYGVQLDMLSLTEEALTKALQEVLSNPIYKKNINKFSELYRDRPMSAKQSVVYWTEYVARHHGAVHMQSPLVHLNTIQYLALDVFAVIFIALYIVWRIIKLGFCFICKKACNALQCKKKDEAKNKNKNKKVKKQ